MQEKVFLIRNSFIFSNIMLYLNKKIMSKIKSNKLSLKFISYLFVAITILTAFGYNGETWA